MQCQSSSRFLPTTLRNASYACELKKNDLLYNFYGVHIIAQILFYRKRLILQMLGKIFVRKRSNNHYGKLNVLWIKSKIDVNQIEFLPFGEMGILYVVLLFLLLLFWRKKKCCFANTDHVYDPFVRYLNAHASNQLLFYSP